MKEECKLESADIDRIFIQADKFECFRIEAEATEYQLNEMYMSMQPISKVISDQMNETGFEFSTYRWILS